MANVPIYQVPCADRLDFKYKATMKITYPSVPPLEEEDMEQEINCGKRYAGDRYDS